MAKVSIYFSFEILDHSNKYNQLLFVLVLNLFSIISLIFVGPAQNTKNTFILVIKPN